MTLSVEQTWDYEIWNRTTGYTGLSLTGVTGGTLTWDRRNAIKGQGKLNVKENTDGPLLNVLIRPVLIQNGIRYPYGLWVPSFPKKSFTSTSWTGTVDLLSLEALLSYTSAASALNTDTSAVVNVASGTVATTWVSNLLTIAGFHQFTIEAAATTFPAPKSWTRGETILDVVNDVLLNVLGYASIFSDMGGTLRCIPYVKPEARAEAFSDTRPFDTAGTPRFTTQFDLIDNAPNVPNRVRVVGQAVGWLPGVSKVAVNDDPTSPYSTVSRGYVVEKVFTEVPAYTDVALQAYADQQLLNASLDGRQVGVNFIHLPNLQLGDVVRFYTERAGNPLMASVETLSVELRDTGLSSATLAAVTAVSSSL